MRKTDHFRRILHNIIVLSLLMPATHPAPASAVIGTGNMPLERIEVAPDGWTFREARSKRPFVPFGVNYTPAWSGWAPDYLSAERFDAAKIEADFTRMQSLGVNVCKIVFPARRILPDPQTPGNVVPDPGCMDRVRQVTDLAGHHAVRLLWTLSPDWLGFPEWFQKGGHWFGVEPRAILSRFWEQFARQFKGDGRVFGFSFSVETTLGDWNYGPALEEWRQWARAKYHTLDAANRAWGAHFGTWDEIPAAGHDGLNAPDWKQHPEGTDENENKTNDPFLYDFLLFREFIAFRFMHDQAVAVKKGDPHALTTMGFVQWNPLLRALWGPVNEGPFQGPEYNVREMARTFDFVGIHFYPVYPNGDDETQLRYLELWARWSFVGKPVVLEEFNGPPAEKNIEWCQKLIRRSRNYVSGWLVWTFQNTPHSDNVTEVCGLLDEEGKLTPWGEAYGKLAQEVKGWTLHRQRAVRTVQVDKRFLYTSGRYREVLDGLIHAGSQAVDFSMESNRSIDGVLKK